MHVLLVHNRASGSGNDADPAAVLVRHGCVVTEADIATAARWRGTPPKSLDDVARVVVAGGDGSLGVAAALAATLDVPLGVVPCGTANDFARAMGLPDDVERAALLAATGDELREVDLGRVQDTPFVNVASLGLSPSAARHARPLKRGIGALAYPVGAAIAAVRSRPLAVVARVDGHVAFSGRAWQVIVASTGAFGGWGDTGGTRQGDGLLDLVVVPADRGTRELAFDAAAVARGELARRDGVLHARGLRVELQLRRAPQLVVDGELLRADSRHVVATVDRSPVQLVVG